MPDDIKNQKRIHRLTALLRGRRRMLIVIQDHPDPDAIAAAAALKQLAHSLCGTESTVAHGGVVGRAENQAMVGYLGMKLRAMDRTDPGRFDALAMVDTQPGTGNNSLPSGLLPDIVIDHHPIRRVTRRVPFTDVRGRYGATSTILCEYLRESAITPSSLLATALLYGVWSDTQNLGRTCVRADVDAYLYLHTLANQRMLKEIQHGKVRRAYFQALVDSLCHARTCGRSIVTTLGQVDNPDMIGEAADLLFRDEESDSVLCCGFYGGKLLFSLRTSDAARNAGKMAHQLAAGQGTGGGHEGTAGGQIPVEGASGLQRKRKENALIKAFLKSIGERAERTQRLVAIPTDRF